MHLSRLALWRGKERCYRYLWIWLPGQPGASFTKSYRCRLRPAHRNASVSVQPGVVHFDLTSLTVPQYAVEVLGVEHKGGISNSYLS